MTENVSTKHSDSRQKAKQPYIVCRVSDLAPGERRIVDLDGRSVGVFNVNGYFYALLNYCPHNGGALCRGPVTGTTLPTDKYEYIYGQEGAILRCAWHGWEFDIATGESLVDPRIRARSYPVTVENGDIVLHI